MRSTAALLMSPISYAGELIFMPGVYVYKHENDFFQYQPGWLGIAGRTLYSNQMKLSVWIGYGRSRHARTNKGCDNIRKISCAIPDVN